MATDHAAAACRRRLRLHYRKPSSEWSHALPLGNGRLGCMVHGRTTTELLELNEDSVWYGGPQHRTPRDALRNLPRLRQLIRDEKHAEAEELARLAFFSSPGTMRHGEPLGCCYLELGHGEDGIEDYVRELDLETALHTVRYTHNGVSHRRETLASFPDSVLAMRITSSAPEKMLLRLSRVAEDGTNMFLDSVGAANARIVLHATPGGGPEANRLCLVLGVRCDDAEGTVEAIGEYLMVRSSSCVVTIAAQTTYRHDDPEAAARKDCDAALGRLWDVLRRRHVADYQALFGRTGLAMTPDAAHLPTDERIAQHRDAGLVALYHHYGRYLLIASSRDMPKPLPATLQGIWNPHFSPPWGAKYTININLQMNYWPAAPCNLADCLLPVVDLVERMAVRGRATARSMYGCGGWCAHHNTDIWADTDPTDIWMAATLWPLGGVWLTAELVQALQYRYDAALHRRVAPLLQGCVEFLLDFLVVSADGRHLVTSPSLSPENTFVSADGSLGVLCEGSAIDMSLIRMLFEQYVWSESVAGASTAGAEGLLVRVQTALGRPASDDDSKAPCLPDLLVNDAGRIQEWGLNDYGEHELGHRHISHLFALYPACQIDRIRTPALCAAARRVLDRRAAHGGGHTGWSRAWLLNLHARLGDAAGCGGHMDKLLETSTLPNLLDTHPPFQIDGNFGACAGVLECLLQSVIVAEDDTGPHVRIAVLPACPAAWQAGTLERVLVRGGWAVTFSWEQGGRLRGPVRLAKTQDTPLPFVLLLPSGEVASAASYEVEGQDA